MENKSGYTLITGATSGIGHELAKIFAKNGHHLIIVSRDADEVEHTSMELRDFGVDVQTLVCDLFKPENAFVLYELVKEKGLEVNILVNDAGQGEYGLFKDTAIDRELDIINLNVSSLLILTKCFLLEMVERGQGKILNVASIAGTIPGPWQSVYHGTKAFVLSFTAAIREELKDTGVSVTALLPGVTATDFFQKAGMAESEVIQDKDALSDPADVAQDGYDALMAGKDRVISGFKNKMEVAIGNIIPDSILAHSIAEQQKPVKE